LAGKDFSVRIGQEEIGHILNRKENVDHHAQMWNFMSRYRTLGWDLAVITAQGADLGLDLEQPQQVWWRQLADLGLDGIQLNLAVRTGHRSGLLVLEVSKGRGALSLDLLGDWRANCVAELGNSWELHFFALPPGPQAPPSFFMAQEVLIYGEDGSILAPPSIEPESRESWRWLTPPWEKPPLAPKPAVWQFIREQLGFDALGTPKVPDWEEIYRVIIPHAAVLKALLVPPSSMDDYYCDILTAGLAAGLRDRRVLLGLLWHAPYGDARSNKGRWQFLQDLVARGESDPHQTPGVPAFRENFPEGAWPWGTAPEPGGPEGSGLMVSLNRSLGVGELSLQLSEPSLQRFDKSIYGQFFQLLAALGEKVIAEIRRVKTVQADIGAEAAEMERLAVEIKEYIESPATGDKVPAAGPAAGVNLAEIPWQGGAAAPSSKLQEVRATVQDFFRNNPDLAGEQGGVQMLLFCLRNYVSISPDYAGLSFRDKLTKGGQMARDFLSRPPEVEAAT
jgi:hypothetical protein